jgi:hypothetical protein
MLPSGDLTEVLAHYGVPLALVAIGSWLFWATRPRMAGQHGHHWPFLTNIRSVIHAISNARSEQTDEISLLEAATRAYEQTRNSPIAIVAEPFGNNTDGILIWYCDEMVRFRDGKQPLVKLYGNRPPSRDREEIYMAPLSNYDFVVENGAVILQDKTGLVRYENLLVSASEVASAIAELARREV